MHTDYIYISSLLLYWETLIDASQSLPPCNPNRVVLVKMTGRACQLGDCFSQKARLGEGNILLNKLVRGVSIVINLVCQYWHFHFCGHVQIQAGDKMVKEKGK